MYLSGPRFDVKYLELVAWCGFGFRRLICSLLTGATDSRRLSCGLGALVPWCLGAYTSFSGEAPHQRDLPFRHNDKSSSYFASIQHLLSLSIFIVHREICADVEAGFSSVITNCKTTLQRLQNLPPEERDVECEEVMKALLASVTEVETTWNNKSHLSSTWDLLERAFQSTASLCAAHTAAEKAAERVFEKDAEARSLAELVGTFETIEPVDESR